MKSFRVTVPQFRSFRPGQHVDIRLTAPDGYQAQRSYSIASTEAGSGTLELTVELLEDGEVSPYFHDVVREGDQFELRGPIGGPFTWTADRGGPSLLVGGGSGVVPLMSMLRHRAMAMGQPVRAALLYSARSINEVIYREELERMVAEDASFDLFMTLTRSQPPDWADFSRRVDEPMLQELVERLGRPAHSYVCGPTSFVETVATLLVDSGIPASDVHTERFGPSGA